MNKVFVCCEKEMLRWKAQLVLLYAVIGTQLRPRLSAMQLPLR